MASVTREEFETVKELLGSAARYAESANRGVERLQMAQENTQMQISLLAQSQRLTDQRLEALAAQAQKTEQRLESFISETQRLLTGQAERLAQLEVIADRLAGVLAYLTRKDDQGQGGSN
ncbi:hypothetical protein [Leptolyngbya sp. FACHB-8]|uniref:hypothetical protein n=1 Tax=unclassified Leptolyngbya TaxID=2650499 RepID=UPI0016841441|nr:hypothetical protein [Leptolyngbya sp. FACHB-8]MBD1911265.1 hypothetical protein [Leptolyngbya sp. FACHB-8]